MDKEKMFENYKMAKMNFQMLEAYLEGVTIKKYEDILKGDYNNEISFGIRTDKKSDNEYKGFLKTTVLCKNDDTDEVELHIEVIYSGLFKTNEQLEDAQMEEWVEAQLVPQLLSYSRSIITHLTSFMTIPPILLPTMDVIESLNHNDHLNNDEE